MLILFMVVLILSADLLAGTLPAQLHGGRHRVFL